MKWQTDILFRTFPLDASVLVISTHTFNSIDSLRVGKKVNCLRFLEHDNSVCLSTFTCQKSGFCFQILIRTTNILTLTFNILWWRKERERRRKKNIMSIKKSTKGSCMSLFVHVDQLNKRETFDAHCINVCHQEEQEKNQNKTK